MPSETVAQREGELHPVRRHSRSTDHLRSNLRVLVRAEESVVHKIAVVPRDVGGRPDWIEDLQIGLRHEAEGLLGLLGLDRRCIERASGGRSRASDELSSTDAKRMSHHCSLTGVGRANYGTRLQVQVPRPVTTSVSAEKYDELASSHCAPEG